MQSRLIKDAKNRNFGEMCSTEHKKYYTSEILYPPKMADYIGFDCHRYCKGPIVALKSLTWISNKFICEYRFSGP